MDEYTAEAFVNRDEPLQVPFIAVSPTAVEAASSGLDAESHRQKLKRAFSPSRIKTNPQESSVARQEKDETPSTPSLKTSLQDRLFSR